MIRTFLASLLLLLAVPACGAQAGTPVELPDGASGLRWGDGPYGVVLVPDEDRGAASWDEQARTFADEGMTVMAVDVADPEILANAIRTLHGEGIARVAVLAAGAGTDAALAVGTDEPDLVDQLIVLSADAEVSGLGVFPKLFVAGEPDAEVAERLADEARGDWNDVYVASGDETGQAILEGEGAAATLEAIVARLEERR